MDEIVDEAGLDDAVERFKLLGDRSRLRILRALVRSETCVCDLVDELNVPQPLVSYHLGKLQKAGLVHTRRDGLWTYYSLDPAAWAQVTAPLSDLLVPLPLPLEATYGSNTRCAMVPPDPARGAHRDRDAVE